MFKMGKDLEKEKKLKNKENLKTEKNLKIKRKNICQNYVQENI